MSDDNEKFVDLVIYAWVCWTGRAAINLRPASAGNVMGTVSTPEEARYELPLNEDAFLLIDRRYGELPKSERNVIDQMYFKGDLTDKDLKRRRLSRYLWKKRVSEARLRMYHDLLPQIEGWRP